MLKVIMPDNVMFSIESTSFIKTTSDQTIILYSWLCHTKRKIFAKGDSEISVFETSRKDFKADFKGQPDMYRNSLGGDMKANYGGSFQYIGSQKKNMKVFRPLKEKEVMALANQNFREH